MINVIFNDPHYEIMPKRKEMFDKYCKILQWGRRHPTRFAEQFFNLQLTDHQKWLFLNSWIPSTNVWVCSRSTGKCLALNTRVYPVIRDRVQRDGKELSEPHTIGELKVGDWIYDENCKPAQVKQLHPIVLDDEYKVYFSDGDVIPCNGVHQWCVFDGERWGISETDLMYQNIDKVKFYVPMAKWTKEFIKDYGIMLNAEDDVKEIVKIEKTNEKVPMRCITVDNDTGLYLCGNYATVTHNSYMASIFLMLKSILFPHFNSFIMAPSGDQAKATFTKMENLAKNNIASAVGVTRVFIDECVRQNAKADPFTHNANGYEVNLYNGSRVTTLNSVAKNIVGWRSNLSIYDEAGKFCSFSLKCWKVLRAY